MIQLETYVKLYETKGKQDGSGSTCRFWHIDDQFGIKVYRCEQRRDKAYWMQKYCADYDVAPLVGERFQFNCINPYHGESMTCYGYVTEVAEILKAFPKDPDITYEYEEYGDYLIRYTRELYAPLGLFDDDTHYNNSGIYKGKIMCVDFGLFGMKAPLLNYLEDVDYNWDLKEKHYLKMKEWKELQK